MHARQVARVTGALRWQERQGSGAMNVFGRALSRKISLSPLLAVTPLDHCQPGSDDNLPESVHAGERAGPARHTVASCKC